ncbi:unnamed protein product [Calypogeia fissa]
MALLQTPRKRGLTTNFAVSNRTMVHAKGFITTVVSSHNLEFPSGEGQAKVLSGLRQLKKKWSTELDERRTFMVERRDTRRLCSRRRGE